MYCTSYISRCGLSSMRCSAAPARLRVRPYCRRRNVSLLTPNIIDTARYVSLSPGSRALITAIASEIGSIVVDLSRIKNSGLVLL
jgi:hypothetical protein